MSKNKNYFNKFIAPVVVAYHTYSVKEYTTRLVSLYQFIVILAHHTLALLSSAVFFA